MMDWKRVAKHIDTLVRSQAVELNQGQQDSLYALAKRLPENGVIVADEVGMGKTRIAAVLARAVIEAGGRVAILVPPGLGYQWGDELRKAGVADVPPLLRSLDAYLNAWVPEQDTAGWQHHQALLISHAFANWRLTGNAANWRWTLLPAVLKCLTEQNRPSGQVRLGNNRQRLDDERINCAAQWICDTGDHKALDKLFAKYPPIWGENSPLFDIKNYQDHAPFRAALENVVGIGLGYFDLVIIDEAHRNRGHDSGLEFLLHNIVFQSPAARRLAMTATPIELSAQQWMQILQRIEVKVSLQEPVTNYIKAVSTLIKNPHDKGNLQKYQATARVFQQRLAPYLLRRDKRDDPAVQQFHDLSKLGYHAYRREQEIEIETTELDSTWKQAVCAAEALSFVIRRMDNSAIQRLRLTVGNGHGVAALIAQQHAVQAGDDSVAPAATNAASDMAQDKRLQRAQWWKQVTQQPFAEHGSSMLFEHPAILATVKAIEDICADGEKVLVFGRFTRPMHALVQLLNARQMLRCLQNRQAWAQAKVHADEWSAIQAAHRQLQSALPLEPKRLDEMLAAQYQTAENQRRKIREHLIGRIEQGLQEITVDSRIRQLFAAFRNAVARGRKTPAHAHPDLAIVARAMQELIADAQHATPADFAQAFKELVAAASDHDAADRDDDESRDEAFAADLWRTIADRLHEEYNSPEGGFARLMNGGTRPETRRLLQLAFNRTHSNPQVLVAQSLVGREGLNLHTACRSVVLLHPEWNPGVVEQQIGRVDRMGSLWEQKLSKAAGTPDELPRIEIYSVIFRGTYDEANWHTLRERWQDLRAQLHGVVISDSMVVNGLCSQDLADKINGCAPCFKPTP